MKPAFRVLVLGSSDVTFSESGPEGALPALLLRELTVAFPEADWEVDSALLYPTAAMLAYASQQAELKRPDAIYLSMGTNTFVERTVLFSIRRRRPWLYPLAARVIAAGKIAGGGGAEGHAGLLGALFRVPRRLGRALFGSASFVEPSVALASTRATFAMLAVMRVPVVVRLAEGNVQQEEQREAARALTNEYNDAVLAMCREYGFPVYHLSREMGAAYQRTPDGLHGDLETRRQGALRAAARIGEALVGAPGLGIELGLSKLGRTLASGPDPKV